LGFGLGVGFYSFLLYIALLAGVALSPGLVIVLTLVCLVAGLAIFPWRNLRRPLSEVAAGPLVIDRRALVYLVVFSAFALIAAALAVGQAYHWSDEVVLWGIKGYGISDLGLSAGVSEWGTRTTSYPLHLPLMIASFRAVFGDVMPESKILFPLYFLSLMVLVFDFLRQRLNVHLAAGLTLLYGASPLIFFHARLAYANLPLTFYLTSAAILLDGALRSSHSGKQGFNPDRHSLFLSGIFFTLAAWTRPEGLVMSAATLLLASIMLVWRAKPSSKPTQPLSAILSLCGPFLIYLIVWSFSSPLVYQQPGWSGAAFLVGLEKIVGNQINLESTAFVLKSFFDIRLQLEAWGLLVFSIISLVAFVPFFFYKQHTASLLAGIGLLYLLVVLGMYILLANDPASNPSWWVDTGLSRMLMPGLTLLWLGLIDWAAMVSQERPSNDLQQPASG
jgi:hypothetical protein